MRRPKHVILSPNARSQDSRSKSKPDSAHLSVLTHIMPRLTKYSILRVETHLRKSPKKRKHQVFYQHVTLFQALLALVEQRLECYSSVNDPFSAQVRQLEPHSDPSRRRVIVSWNLHPSHDSAVR